MKDREASQRGRGRSGGRAVSERGRMRKRGPSGGGTLRRKLPQQGQWPSLGVGAVISARIHWPRASQSGLMHCTVKPGKYCIESPSEAVKLRPIHARPDRGRTRKTEAPLVGQIPRHALPRLRTRQIPMQDPKGRQGRAGTKQLMGRILARESCGVKRKDYKILW